MKGALRLDRLLGRRVLAGNNKTVGRLEEVRAARHGQGYVVTEYVIGAAGLFERLNVGFRALLWRRGHGAGRLARWDQIDISDPEHPRLTCSVEELREL